MVMSDLEKIKQIAQQMPEGREKQKALETYKNLKLFETIADSFDSIIESEDEENGR